MENSEATGGLEFTTGVLLSVVGGVALLIGAIGTWAKASAGFLSASVSGVDTDDGKIVLVVGIAVLVLALIGAQRTSGAASSWLVFILGAIGLIVSVIDLSDVSDRVGDAERASSLVHASVGWGLILCAVGGGIAMLGGLLRAGEARQRKSLPDATAET